MANGKVHPMNEIPALSQEANNGVSASADYAPASVIPMASALALPEEPPELSEEDADSHEHRVVTDKKAALSPHQMTSVRSIAGEQKQKVVH